jgi:hypothetical protein
MINTLQVLNPQSLHVLQHRAGRTNLACQALRHRCSPPLCMYHPLGRSLMPIRYSLASEVRPKHAQHGHPVLQDACLSMCVALLQLPHTAHSHHMLHNETQMQLPHACTCGRI